MRTYTFKPVSVPEWLALYRAEALEVQNEYLGDLVGFFTTEFGNVNQVVHIWRFAGLDDRARRRDQMATDPRWQAFVTKVKNLGLLVSMESKILKPTDFSPLR
ncbi:NIPSNAP family protein [Paraburkholderia flava]|uniref:NIPSNAP family protein n=1 Tax=Paraburkholderia flava TaxID=2547393 RepID=UPI001F0FDA6E|nr:NIPSNAP family protein [Paraburkholderia flava]